MPQHIGIVACSAEGASLCYRTIATEDHSHPEVSMTKDTFLFVSPDRGPQDMVELFRRYYGPTMNAFEAAEKNGKVLVANPALPNPLLDASEIEPLGRGRDGVERGRIVLASGLGNHGEPARIERDRRGLPSGFWLAGMKLLPEGQAAKELTARYAPR